MGAQKLSEAGVFAVHVTAACAILAAFVTALLLHESVRILVQFLAHSLMILQIGLQRRVAFYELPVFRQRRIAAELLGDLLVLVKELIEADYLSVVAVTRILACIIIRAVAVVLTVVAAVAHIIVIAITSVAICVSVIGITVPYILTIVVALPIIVVVPIVVASACVVSVVVPPSVVAVNVTIASLFVVVEAVFLPHEGIRILIQSLLDIRVLLQISLQCRMVLQELLIFYQRRIATKLFGGFAVSVKKTIELRHLGTTIIISTVRITLAILTVHIAPVVIAVTVLTGVIVLPVINTVARQIAVGIFALLVLIYLLHVTVWISR